MKAAAAAAGAADAAGVTVRAAAVGELEALAPDLARLPLLADYGIDAATLAASLRRAQAQGEGLLIATVGPTQAACGLGWYAPRGGLGRAAYLRLLAVLPQYAARGVGRALLAAFEKATAAAPGGQLLLCNADNAAALRFYARWGYVEVGRLDGFVRPGKVEVLLRRPATVANVGARAPAV